MVLKKSLLKGGNLKNCQKLLESCLFGEVRGTGIPSVIELEKS